MGIIFLNQHYRIERYNQSSTDSHTSVAIISQSQRKEPTLKG